MVPLPVVAYRGPVAVCRPAAVACRARGAATYRPVGLVLCRDPEGVGCPVGVVASRGYEVVLLPVELPVRRGPGDAFRRVVAA